MANETSPCDCALGASGVCKSWTDDWYSLTLRSPEEDGWFSPGSGRAIASLSQGRDSDEWTGTGGVDTSESGVSVRRVPRTIDP
jgi:hypothetical protein